MNAPWWYFAMLLHGSGYLLACGLKEEKLWMIGLAVFMVVRGSCLARDATDPNSPSISPPVSTPSRQ